MALQGTRRLVLHGGHSFRQPSQVKAQGLLQICSCWQVPDTHSQNGFCALHAVLCNSLQHQGSR